MDKALESIHNLLLATDSLSTNNSDLKILLERIEEILKSSDKHGLEYNIAILFGHDDEDVEGRNVIAFIKRSLKSGSHFVVEFLKFIENLCLLYPEILINFVEKIINISKDCALLPPSVKSNTDVAERGNNLIRTAVEVFHTPYNFSTIYDDVVKNQIQLDCIKVPKVYLAVFKLVGVLSQFCPDSIQPVKCDLLQEAAHKLAVEGRKPEEKRAYLVVEGSFEAINGLLLLFTQDETKTPILSLVLTNIYNSMKLVIDAEHRHRHSAHRVAFSILENHTEVFLHRIKADYIYWHEALIKWIDHKNKDDKEISLRAQNAYLRQMARLLANEQMEIGEKKQMLEFFFNYLRKKIAEEKNASNVAAAVEGIGVFAPAFATILDSSKIEKLFEDLVQKIDSIFPQSDDDSNIFYLSEYLGTLAAVGGLLNENLKQHQLENLERISVKLISACNTLSNDKLDTAVASIAICCLTAFKAGSLVGLKNFINLIVYQGIIKACCQQPFINFEETTSFKVVIDDYMPFWEKLLSINNNKKIGEEGIVRAKESIVELIYEAIIESIVKMINNLDVNFEDGDNFDEINVGGTAGLKAHNDADMAIVMNLEFLFSKLLPKIEIRLHEKYISFLLRNLTSVSTKNPLLPSYYKLLATVLCIAEKLGFFEADNKFEDSDVCQKELNYYIGDLLVNLHYYHKDIQEACLRVITSSSVELIATHLQQLPAAFKVLFHIGRSDLELSSMGVSAIDRWMSKLSREELTPFFKQVIPYLYPFLDNRRIKVAFPDHFMEYAQSVTSRRSKHVSKRRKLVEDFRKETSLSETELTKLQQSILMLLGRLDMTSLLSLLDQDYTDVIRSWTRKPVVSWEMKFRDLHVLIDLDLFAPRAMEIALQSSDPANKDASFELLHAIFVIFLANTMNLTHEETTDDHIHFLRKILPGMFKLGCKTSDPVGRNIFNNLMKQTCHWYARKYCVNQKFVEIFVDSLLEALTCPTDIEVREFAAECLQEYVAWTIKPTEEDRLLKTDKTTNVFEKTEYIISKIIDHCFLPCPFKRQGVAMGFNRIYRELRKQRDDFWMAIFHQLFNSLAESLLLPHPSRELFAALDHISLLWIERRNSPRKKDEPKAEVSDPLLLSLVSFLFNNANNSNEKCREKFMGLITQLVVELKDINSLADFVAIRGIHEDEKDVTNKRKSEMALMSDLMLWLDSLSGSVHKFKWLKENKVDVASVICSENSRFLKNVNFYISEISSCSAGSIDWLTGESSPFCPQLSAIDAYDRSRCRLTLHILSFLSSLEEDLARLADFFQKDVWQWLSRCLVGPAFIGFTAVSQNQLSTLRSSLSLLLSKLVHHCGNGLKENFVRPIITSLEETECCQLATGLSKLIKSQAIAVKLDSLNTLIVLKQNNLLDADDQDLIKDEILWSSAKLICTIANCLVRESLKAMIPDKSQTLYLELLLDFAFLLQPDISTLIECMCDETLLKYEDDDKSRNVILGQHFTNTLNEKIFGHLCKFPTECVVEFLKKFPKNSSFISNYLCTLLDRCRNCENSVKLNIALKINSVFPPEPPELDSTIPLIYAIRNFLPGHNIRKSGLSNIFNYLLNGLNGKDRIQRPRVLKTLLQISFVNTSDVQNTPTSQEDDNLLSSLKKFMSNNFPTSSKEWGIDSHWYREVFNILLEMIKRTGNKDLVLLVTDVMAADIDHPFREKLKDILGRPSTLKNNSACVLDELYKRLANKGKSEVLIEFVQDFMLPIIQAASLKMAEEFFLKHIKDIVVLLKEDNKNVRMSSTNLNNSLSTRAASMLLIGALFSKFPSSDLTSIENPIVQKSEEIDKNKNDAVLLRNCTARVIGCLEDELREATRKEIKDDLYLSYKQIAFNTLVILISNTKRDAKDVRFYVFLFKNIKFTMPRELISISNMVFDEIPKRKKALIGIRRAVRAEKRKRHYSMSSIESHQLFTQSMESSTFADDICKYNFSNVHMREHEPSYCDAEDTDQMLVELEADHLNNHPCMPPLCGMIMNLHKITTDATPSTSEGAPKVEGKPDWIKFISDALQSSSTTQSNEEINAKLLLIKLLHNCNETNVNIFSPYAKHLLPAIINFIIENKVRCFGNKMNYMIGDVLGMLTSWSAVATPNNVEIYQLLSFLFEKTPDDRKDVMKLNIETVKTVISSWKDNITTVPHETVLDFLTDKTSRSKLQSSLEIICCLLNCNIKPYADENLDRFYKALKNNAFSRDGSIRKNSAEILGMLCRFLTNNDGASVSSIEERFDLKKLAKDISLQAHDKNDNTGGLSNMILFVSLMKNHYPRIVTYFIKDTVPLLSKIHGSLQQHVLGIVNTALELDKEEKLYPMELYLDVKCKLLNIFRLGDVDNQETALKVVLTLRHFINDEDLGLLMQEVVKHFSNHSSLKCRKAYYDVLVTVYEYYQITPSAGNMELSSSEHEQLCAKDLVTNALVSGLEDSNEELRNQLFQFWNNEERLRSDLVSRLEDLFKLLYKPDLESSFLSLFLELLLTVCKLNPAYYSCIFSDRGGRSTDQSEIVDMKLSRVNSASVAPILVRTVTTKHQSSYSSFAGSVGSAASFRSTQHQSLLFKPSVDADAPPIPTVGSSSLHSFAFDATVSPSRHTHGKRPYSGNDSVDDDDVDDGDFKVPAYKARRLQSDKQKISQSVAYMNQRRNVMMQNELKEQKSKLESEVHLTRKYTKDDLPDRSLTNENVVVCLLKFAKKDTTIASQLVTSLLKGIIHGYQKKWSEPHNQEESKRLSEKLISIIDETFTRIMSDTKHATRGVMSVVLDTCLTFASELTSSRCVDKLYDVSNRSGLHSLGVLVLENSLSRGSSLMETEDPPLENSNIWVYLARLYRSLGFSEIVQGIFEEKLASVDVREALESEADGELKMASNKYQSIARNVQLGEVDEQQVDFIYEAYFNCMARMADWDSLKKALLDVNDVDEMWNDNWSKETLLPWLFRSELNSALSAKTKNVEPFMSNLKAWLGDREKSDYIKTNIGEELSMLHLVNKSIDRALEVSENNRKLFLEDWMQLPALSHNLIMDKCLQLQRLMDIESALAVLKACKLKTNDWFPNCIDLLQKWDSNPPLKSDSLAHWEIRTKYRAHFCAAVLKEWKNPEISNYESSYYLTLLDLALQHENGYVAKKVLQKGNRKKPLWIAGQSRAELLVAQKFVDLGSKLEKICTSWEKIDGLNKTANIDLHVKLVSQKHITEICKALHSVVSMNRDLYYEKLNEKEICWFHKQFPNIDLRDSGCFLMKLYEEGLNSLEVAVRIADETVGVNSKAELADTYLTLAKYCQQQSDTGRCLTVESKMIESLLRAMKFGSREARQLFPAILSLPNLDESHCQVFVEESEQVPVWMFLLWVNQILARTYTEARPTLEPLLRRLLREYPHAVQYQVMLCVRSSNNTPPFLESFRTVNNMAEDFVEAVKYVILPATTLSNYLMDIEKSISCRESTEGIITKWNNLEQVVDALFSEDANRLKGSLYVDFQNKNKALGRELRILLDKRPLRVDDDSYSLFKKTLCDSRLWKMDSPQRLSSFSTYFKHYPSSPAFRIEVPGQYSGDSMPIPDKIVKISRFSERVTVMKSVRKPVKMSVIGNDGIEYGFLVKQGEDLRQDQRIMQTFRQMDSFLTLDNVNSPVIKYSLKTYNVIPFTPRLGLISWVDDSTSLEAFIKSCLDRREKEQFEKTIVNHLKWLPSGASQKHQYQNLYTEVSRENAVSNFRKNVLSLPQDILRRGILELSQSAESYHYLRTQFGTSLAAMSVCHWLVGIGDRHLNNSLLCLGTGQLCGIDFGHAFGSATEILSIPELLPFRLTPQMLNLFEPFRVTGLIKESMCRCLEILRKRKLFIMASIDVFIHEPLMDWAEQAKYCAILNGVDITETDFNSLPMEKIERAREKLDGANPVLVMAKDLKSGHGSKSYYKCVLSMLEGEKGSLRNSKAKDGLSAREQVECLIDLATDEHILGKSYCGLNAWV